MYEPTTGELRDIMERIRTWQMYIQPILARIETGREEALDTIEEFENMFTEKYHGYYIKRKTEDKSLSEVQIYGEVTDLFRQEQPKFYDVDAIFSACSEEDKKKTERWLSEARDYLQP